MVNIENGNVNKGQSNFVFFLKVEISKVSSGNGPHASLLLSRAFKKRGRTRNGHAINDVMKSPYRSHGLQCTESLEGS